MKNKKGKRYSTAVQKNVEDLMEYFQTLSDKDKKYAMQFYREYYANAEYDLNDEELIMKGDEERKENRRRHNSTHRDVFSLLQKTDDLSFFSPTAPTIEAQVEQKPPCEWREQFKKGGYEAALKIIHEVTIDELINTDIDYDIILNRYYLKREALRKLWNKERKEIK